MIRIETLVKTYGAVRALDGLEMTVEPGVIFGFLGSNGAGKTTTLRILTGLARPTSGQVSIAGTVIPANGQKLARRIGYLPEEPSFYPWMTADEFLDYLGRLYGLSSSEHTFRTRELLSLTGLDKVAKRRIGGFSRGMRQRLGIAAALVHRPDVLLLDEPVSALDPAGRKEILELLGSLRGQCTVLMSTHILADVERICDVVGIIAHGKMIAQAPREGLLASYAMPAFEIEGDDLAALSRWGEELRLLTWVTAVITSNGALRVTVRDVRTAKRELLPLAVKAGLSLNRYEEVRPSLEDVFLELVGREGAR